MKIALIGATGFVGAAILEEALGRGHAVTGIVRDVDKLPARTGLAAVKADVYDETQLTAVLRGHAAVISAFNAGWANPNIFADHVRGSKSIQASARKAGVTRLLVVGGAGSLEVKPGVQLVDVPEFPSTYKEGALAAREALNLLREERELEWTFLSPPAMLEPGARTGKYRTGADRLLMDGASPAGISVSDLAVAVLDEIERPKHVRARFTVARVES